MKSILKSVIFVTVFSLLSMNVMAQQTPVRDGAADNQGSMYHSMDMEKAKMVETNANFNDWWTKFGADPEDVDLVTVGSLMPYRVEKQGQLGDGLTFTHHYKWLFSLPATAGANTNLPIGFRNLVDSAVMEPQIALNVQNDAHYYLENAILARMPSTTGDIALTTNVRTYSIPQETQLCSKEGGDTISIIRVVAAPAIDWDDEPLITGCVQDVEIAIDLSSAAPGDNKQIEIEFTMKLNGNDFKATGDNTPGTVSRYYLALADDAEELSIDGDFFKTISPFGVWEIHIVRITDRISRKSITSIQGDVPSVPLVANIVPAPSTKPLQHIRNVPTLNPRY